MRIVVWRKNKTGTSKVGAISKAQKAQNIFEKKTWNFREDCSLKKRSKKENAPTKKGHCYSRAFFLKRKTRRLKKEIIFGTVRLFAQKIPTFQKGSFFAFCDVWWKALSSPNESPFRFFGTVQVFSRNFHCTKILAVVFYLSGQKGLNFWFFENKSKKVHLRILCARIVFFQKNFWTLKTFFRL